MDSEATACKVFRKRRLWAADWHHRSDTRWNLGLTVIMGWLMPGEDNDGLWWCPLCIVPAKVDPMHIYPLPGDGWTAADSGKSVGCYWLTLWKQVILGNYWYMTLQTITRKAREHTTKYWKWNIACMYCCMLQWVERFIKIMIVEKAMFISKKTVSVRTLLIKLIVMRDAPR